MSVQKTLEIAKISNELWGDNLWYRQLDQEGKDAVALTVWLMRNPAGIKAPARFSKLMLDEASLLFANWRESIRN